MTRRTSIKPDFACAVHEYLLIEQTTLAPADFALVFGNKNIIAALAEKAADLYHSGYVPLIAVSGGVKVKGRLTEAEALRQGLLAHNVPDDAILTEPKAGHTGENVTFTRALMAAGGLDAGLGSVISIGHIIAARRFLMTLERHWPELHKMHVSANPFAVAARDWHLHETFRRHTLMEWRKIAPYLQQDLIREIDRTALDAETARRLNAPRVAPPASCPGPALAGPDDPIPG
ncbi:MAG: YdcF family protein [Micavibrio aeruginosavorus]|uniref:YdcF family protein n=1 Tax=Micavibrio aeruginosavorus TaxID=349221 RepID=A0A7T5R2D6_9BACT|nr:MAG: YdcF family protein [Micavibrio aeruginosavorus]